MVQGRRRFRLALKAAERLRIARDFSGQELQRDKSMQAYVFCLVDHTRMV